MTNNQLTDKRIEQLLECAKNYDLTAFAENDDLVTALLELQEHRTAAALHFQRGYDEGHSRGLTCGKLHKGDDQMRWHRAACVSEYRAEISGEECDE